MLSPEKIKQYERITGHSIYGPSGMSRIVRCPASVKEMLRTPPAPSSDYAKHGSLLHDVIAKATTQTKLDPYVYVKRQMALDSRDKVLLADALDYYFDEFVSANIPVQTETVVSLEPWGLPEVYGTADKTTFVDGEMRVLDWKFGSGEQVFAEYNEQLMTYAAGCVPPSSDIRQVQIHVVQPALNHYDSWRCSMDVLRSFIWTVVTPAIKATQDPAPEYVPGPKQCRFCPAKARCVARLKQGRTLAAQTFEVYAKATKEPPQITNDQIAAFLLRANELERCIRDLRKMAQAEIAAGRQVPGFKIVHGRGQRKFANPIKAAKWLREWGHLTNAQLYKAELISVAQAEKLNRQLKKDADFRNLVETIPGKWQLVPEEDPRPAAIFNDPAEAFKKFVTEGDDD